MLAIASCERREAGQGSAAAGAAESTLATHPANLDTALFAAGCFWCVESAFDAVPGVLSTTSGFTGGHKADPTYDEVSAGGTGHAETVRVVFDSTRVDYEKLLDVFWHNVDPLTPDRQFCDVGSQYRAAVFYRTGRQRELAEASKRRWDESRRFLSPIVTEIVAASAFYPAEDYHQDFYKKDPARYSSYRAGCGRDRRLQELWGEAPQ
jgi:peptide-methionine (S)-S-oxide reductase